MSTDVSERSRALQEALDAVLGAGRATWGGRFAPSNAAEAARVVAAVAAAGGQITLGDPIPQGLALCTSGLRAIREVDVTSDIACVEAGASPRFVEAALREAGLTLGDGHFADVDAPLGHAIAGGEGERLVVSLEAILPDGTLFVTSLSPRRATGPNPDMLLVGTGARFALVTALTLRVRTLPAQRVEVAYAGSGAALLDALRLRLRSRVRPVHACLRKGGRGRATVTVTLASAAEADRVRAALAAAGGTRVEPDQAPPPPFRPRRLPWSRLDELCRGAAHAGLYVGSIDTHGGEARIPGDEAASCPWLGRLTSIVDPGETFVRGGR